MGVAAYQHSTVYLGGLVGGNLYHKTHSGRILSSEANCPWRRYPLQCQPSTPVGSPAATQVAASSPCYALGVLKALDVSASTVRLCGFAGKTPAALALLQRHGPDRRR